MIYINQFFEAVEAYMQVKKEQIYLDESVSNACTNISQIIVTYLEKHNIEMNETEKKQVVEKIYNEILESMDVIIEQSYKKGFVDGLTFKSFIKELK